MGMKRIESMIPVGIGEGAAELTQRGFVPTTSASDCDRWIKRTPQGDAIALIRQRWNGDDLYFFTPIEIHAASAAA